VPVQGCTFTRCVIFQKNAVFSYFAAQARIQAYLLLYFNRGLACRVGLRPTPCSASVCIYCSQ